MILISPIIGKVSVTAYRFGVIFQLLSGVIEMVIVFDKCMADWWIYNGFGINHNELRLQFYNSEHCCYKRLSHGLTNWFDFSMPLDLHLTMEIDSDKAQFHFTAEQ